MRDATQALTSRLHRLDCVTRIILLFSLVQLPAVYAGQDVGPGLDDIPRFHRVAEGLYRGAQPGKDGFDVLKEKGIKTIINLRRRGDQEKAVVERLGMKYVHIPLNAWKKVSDEAIQTFLQVLRDPANYPVFVHCRRGSDRTGMMVGLYRIAFQGWSAGEAYQEARKMGMRWWYRGLKRQLHEFAEKRPPSRRNELNSGVAVPLRF